MDLGDIKNIELDPTQNLMCMGGKDVGGFFVCWGPILKMVYCILMQTDGVWSPYKIYRNTRSKTLKRARQHLKWCNRRYTNSFKIDTIWESVPLEDMEKTYYENEEEILSAIEIRTGRPRGRTVLGFGREQDAGPVIRGDRTEKRLEQILSGLGPEAGPIRAHPFPDSDKSDREKG